MVERKIQWCLRSWKTHCISFGGSEQVTDISVLIWPLFSCSEESQWASSGAQAVVESISLLPPQFWRAAVLLETEAWEAPPASIVWKLCLLASEQVSRGRRCLASIGWYGFHGRRWRVCSRRRCLNSYDNISWGWNNTADLQYDWISFSKF